LVPISVCLRGLTGLLIAGHCQHAIDRQLTCSCSTAAVQLRCSLRAAVVPLRCARDVTVRPGWVPSSTALTVAAHCCQAAAASRLSSQLSSSFLLGSRACLADGWDVVSCDEAALDNR
jgi:hypothetical protein